nr:hypothetical protein [Escherichia coli]
MIDVLGPETGEQVVPASELAAAMKQIKELQRLLNKTPDVSRL